MRSIAVVLSWLVLFVLAGCDGSVREGSPTDKPAQADAAVRADGKNYSDRLNRPLPTLPRVERIVSLSPSTTELLFALDLGDRIVGATKYCNYPEAALQIPRMGGGTLRSLSMESIVAAKPDLVLCQWDSHVPLIENLDRLGITTIALGPQSLEELFEEARWIGRVADRAEEAERLIRRMKDRLEALEQRALRQSTETKPTVFYEVWDSPLMTAGQGSFIDQLMRLARVENIAGDIQKRYPRISPETVIDRDPEVILAPTTHFESVDVDAFAKRPGWSGVAAVREGRIHLIEGDAVSRCGPRMLDALEQMLDAVYGDDPNTGPDANTVPESNMGPDASTGPGSNTGLEP